MSGIWKSNGGLSRLLLLLLLLLSGCSMKESRLSRFGFFTFKNVGDVKMTGYSRYDGRLDEYTITGGGENMWFAKDAFNFAHTTVRGDVSIAADIKLLGVGSNPHRKAGVMIRQSLDEDSAYVDAVVHADGLTSMQFRRVKGADTEEIQTTIKSPLRVLLERNGDVFSFSVSVDGKTFEPVGAVSVELGDKVLAGLAVCSHEADEVETAVFSDVKMEQRPVASDEDRVVESTLEVISIETGRRRVVYRAKEHFEAPNWSRDGRELVFNSKGRLYRIDTKGGKPELLDTGFADNCNNDHGFSPDGKMLVISHHPKGKSSLIYTLEAGGGKPELVTETGPSYWHGWSPDGKTLAYCAERGGEYDVYTIPVEGGVEERLTDAKGLDDGPDYSYDGRYIFFNSVRTGDMRIWRMNADGSEQMQMTSDDEYGDWFPHPSPDGKWIVFLSYNSTVEGHPANKDVALRIMPFEGGKPRILTRLFGGQGTINVPSWSPDSRYVAFVSYRLVTGAK